MNKTLAASLMSVLFSGVALPATADIIKCTFTEPFIGYTYSMAQQSLTIDSATEPTQVVRNVGFQILGPRRFIIGPKDNPTVKLKLDFAGSDGMSDFVYPFSAELPDFMGRGQSLHGGCQSNFLKRKLPPGGSH